MEKPVVSNILLSTLVELSFSAKGLKSKDAFSKSDAVCIISLKDTEDGTLVEIGRTEEIKNNPNPVWVKKIEIEYKFEERQVLVFRLYDWDKELADLKKQDLIGEVECTLGELMVFKGTEVRKVLLKKAGELLINAQEVSGCKEVATVLFSGEKLEKKDAFGKSDPFLVISRSCKDDTYTPVINSGYQKSTLNPNWQAISIPVRTLCNGNYEAKIRIECFDWDKNGKHDLIGECFTTLNALKDGKPMSLVNPKKLSKKGYENSGVLTAQIENISIDKSFLDYVREGVQVHFTVAIDFTASNGNIKEKRSLHYLEEGKDNVYTTAIKAIGSIMEDYDTDKAFPAIGFGARVPPDNKVSHEFFLNGDPKDPYCEGVDGVLAAYKKAAQTVELFGPTNFAPCIKQQVKFGNKYSDGSHYFILLIITDGVVTDLPETMNALIDASSLPLSVIIVGVGSEDFTAMKVLDADDKLISYEGRKAERDVVEFIDFNKFVNENNEVCKGALSRAVLEKVPQQLVAYMKSKKK